jgi:hypothetical protein
MTPLSTSRTNGSGSLATSSRGPAGLRNRYPWQGLGADLAVLAQSRAGRSALLPNCRAANDRCGHEQHADPSSDHPA